MSQLALRYQSVLERIGAACKIANRDPSEIQLIVVTKNHPAELVLGLISLGAREFGENRDQEAGSKAEQVAQLSDAQIDWHFIGQLQTNKVKNVLKYASAIHSLDRPSLLAELIKRTSDRTNPLLVFLEVNLTDDPHRGGVKPGELDAFAESVLTAPGLELAGLMGVAGLGVDPRVDFEKLAGLSQRLTAIAPAARGLSMGMSGDFEEAISHGATHLRIGTAITGNRPG